MTEIGLSGPAPWLQQLGAIPLSERAALLEALVSAEFKARLLMTDADELPLDESYFALGLTSLGATEVQERLQALIGRRIDSASLFNNPTVRHLLTFLRSEVLPEFFVAAALVQGGGPTLPDIAADAAAFDVKQQSQKDLVDDVLKDLLGS